MYTIEAALDPQEKEFIKKFADTWCSFMNKDEVSTSAYKSDIHLVNTSVRPTFRRSVKMRKKKKIITNQRIAALRNPRTTVYNDCYPTSMSAPFLSSNGKVDVDVTFRYG